MEGIAHHVQLLSIIHLVRTHNMQALVELLCIHLRHEVLEITLEGIDSPYFHLT